ncbi:MAG: hypothetical protein M1819_006221 [Sarea resinae]|nr:MAG: hypothetical protein M1819_006221 [Sarea resinae]
MLPCGIAWSSGEALHSPSDTEIGRSVYACAHHVTVTGVQLFTPSVENDYETRTTDDEEGDCKPPSTFKTPDARLQTPYSSSSNAGSDNVLTIGILDINDRVLCFIATYVSRDGGSWASHVRYSSCDALSRAEVAPRDDGMAMMQTSSRPRIKKHVCLDAYQKRCFHNYFVTNLPSSSLHPDSRSSNLPRTAPSSETPAPNGSSSPASHLIGRARDTTTVRIPIRSAKHHFGVAVSRGSRGYNEDTFQAGVIDLPSFAKRAPISLTRSPNGKIESGEVTAAESKNGDPQVFYYGVFDGHGGAECSDFLMERLHGYIEESAQQFELRSSLNTADKAGEIESAPVTPEVTAAKPTQGQQSDTSRAPAKEPLSATTQDQQTTTSDGGLVPPAAHQTHAQPSPGEPSLTQGGNREKIFDLERSIVHQWRETVGGYFRRFRPEYFSLPQGRHDHPHPHSKEAKRQRDRHLHEIASRPSDGLSIEPVLMHAFLRADLDFISAQARKHEEEDAVEADRPLNASDIFDEPSKQIGGLKRFKGGSTCSIALISTPNPTPYWHPASHASLITAHVGDTRILLCETATGAACPLTTDHHPATQSEGRRLRRYATTFVTDSFGEERMSGLANTRAFGDMQSKRIGVSAEPEIRRTELGPAEFSFLVLVSDGISGTLSDQEIVDIVKEARTPDAAAHDVVSFATDVSVDGDNATCLVIRLGGWKRRLEGGLGSLGTKELRDFRREDAQDPRRRMT